MRCREDVGTWRDDYLVGQRAVWLGGLYSENSENAGSVA